MRGEGWDEGAVRLGAELRRPESRRGPLTLVTTPLDLSPHAGRGNFQSRSAPRSGQRQRKIMTPASADIAAIIRKKCGFSIRLQKLPSQPARKPPVKLVASHTPIIIDRMRAGATLVTRDSPPGHR